MRFCTFLFLGLVGLLARPALAQSELLLTHLQVAPDTRSVAFAATTGTIFGVWEQPLSGPGPARRVSLPEQHFHCFAPAYSPDGRYLLYLREAVRTNGRHDAADVLLFDRQAGTTRLLTDGRQLITQALFSVDGQRIIYLAASSFGSLVPGSAPAPHQLDVYSMALDGRDPRRHTHLAAQTLGNLALLRAPDTYLLTAYDPALELAGTYAYSLADSTRLRFVRDSAAASHRLPFLPYPAVSDDMRVGFVIGDELFIKDMRTGHSRLAYAGAIGSRPRPLAFVREQGVLLFAESYQGFEAVAHRVGLLDIAHRRVKLLDLRVE